MFYNYIWIDRSESGLETYYITTDERSVPTSKIAAKVSLTESERKFLRNCTDWNDYQGLLEHLFERGQKVVTAHS